jgi:pilus assembly protein CpaE
MALSPLANSVDASIWRPLVVCPDRELARRILAALAELGLANVPHLTEYPRSGAIASQAAEHHSNLCFVDLLSNEEHALLLVSEAAVEMPVVSLHPRHDAELILRALRRGASDFLSEPGATQVSELLDRLRKTHLTPQTRTVGAVYCVMPGKPGCGASTLAAQFAIEARRLGIARVLLIDGDFLTASVAFQLKLRSDFHLGDALRDLKRMDGDLWSRLTVPSYGVDVLLGPEDCSTALSMTREESSELLSFLRDRYDIVIFDLPGPVMAVETGLATLTGDLLLVTTNELSALHATRRAIEFLERSGIGRERIKLVLNRYTLQTGIKREDVRTVLQLEPMAALANDYQAIQSAILEGRPIPEALSFSRSVANLARTLCHQKDEPAAPARAGGWLSFLNRRK